MSLSWVTVKPSSSNSSVTDKLILIDYGCCGGISVSVGGHAIGICARVVGCVGVGGVLHGDMCKGGGVGGVLHGDMCKGGGVCGCWGGCYMGICARVVGCGGCYMLCLRVLYCVVDCEALCAFWRVGAVEMSQYLYFLKGRSSRNVPELYFLKGRSCRNIPVFVLSEG